MKINNSCENFGEKLKELFFGVNQNINNLNLTHRERSQLLIDEINLNSRENQRWTNEMCTKIIDLVEMNRNSTVGINQVLLEFECDEKETRDSYGNDLTTVLKGILGHQENYQLEMTQKIENLQRLFLEQRNSREKFYVDVLEDAESRKSGLHEFCDTLTENLMSLSDQMIEEHRKHTEMIVTNVSESERLEKMELESIRVMEESLRDLKANILEKQANRNRLHDLKEGINESAIKFVEQLNGERQTIEEYRNEVISDLKLEGIVGQLRTDDDQSLNENTNEIKTTNELNSTFLGNTKAQLTIGLDSTNKYLDSREKSTIAHTKDIQSKLTSLTETLNTTTNDLKTQITNEKDRITHSHIQTTAFGGSLQEFVIGFEERVNEQMIACNDELDHFTKNELKIYSPSGQTPIRKQFTIDRMEPHDRIIQRLRMERGYNSFGSVGSISSQSQSLVEENGVGGEFNTELSNMQIMLNNSMNLESTTESIVISDDDDMIIDESTPKNILTYRNDQQQQQKQLQSSCDGFLHGKQFNYDKKKNNDDIGVIVDKENVRF